MNNRLKFYLLTFNSLGVDVPRLHYEITQRKELVGYWNYMPLIYGLKSYYEAPVLRQVFQPFFPGGNFMIAEINPGNIDGSLPAPAWQWFYPEQQQIAMGPPPSLGDLLKPPS